MLIHSVHNSRVKAALRLREAHHRLRENRILIDGTREVLQAAGAGFEFEHVFVCEALCGAQAAGKISELAASTSAELLEVTPDVARRLAFGDRATGLVAVAVRPARSLADLGLGTSPLVAVLEGVEKPGNFGAVLRTADAAGLSGVILADAAIEPWNPNAIRASLGTIFTVPWCSAAAAEVVPWLAAQGLQIVAARLDADRLYTEVDLTLPTAMVLGSEAVGLTPLWSMPAAIPVRLPMRGAADSLNLSATAAVLFYEAVRQRRR
jgi:TrmH family RNA methyltransferase